MQTQFFTKRKNSAHELPPPKANTSLRSPAKQMPKRHLRARAREVGETNPNKKNNSRRTWELRSSQADC